MTHVSAQEIIIREAQPGDAERLIAYVKALADEPEIHIGLSPGEFNLTVEQEQAILEEYSAAPNSIYLLAEIGAEVVGVLNCKGGNRQSTRHAVTLGMSVARDWRDSGIGSLLLGQAISWARQNELVRRIELAVFVENERAIHLYRKFGFEQEGRLRKAIYRDGAYHDNAIMALLL